MSDRPPALPQELEALVDADLRASLGSETERQAIFARVLNEVGLRPSGGSGGAPPVAGGAGGLVKALLVVALVTGGGIAGYLALRDSGRATVAAPSDRAPSAAVSSPTVSVSPVEPKRAPLSLAAPSSEPAGAEAPSLVAPSRQTRRARRTRDRAPSPADTAAPTIAPPPEEALIEAAWTEHARHRSRAALRLLSEHEQHYPGGRLAEERDALRVLALASAGRTADARASAEAFRGAYPESIHLAAIQAALGNAGGQP